MCEGKLIHPSNILQRLIRGLSILHIDLSSYGETLGQILRNGYANYYKGVS